MKASKLPLPTTKAKQRDLLDVLIPTLAVVLRQLRRLREQLHNRSGKRGRRSAPPTARIRRAVQRLRRTTNMSNQEIAQHLRISSGRVTEITRGARR